MLSVKRKVEKLFKKNPVIENFYYEEITNGPDKLHVIFIEDINEEGYIDWMRCVLTDNNISDQQVIIANWIDIDQFLDNVFKVIIK
jgi:hypothetical protein